MLGNCADEQAVKEWMGRWQSLLVDEQQQVAADRAALRAAARR